MSSELLVKKDTVNGIMGKTHGVSSAINPPSMPNKNIFHQPFTPPAVSFGTNEPNRSLDLRFKSKAVVFSWSPLFMTAACELTSLPVSKATVKRTMFGIQTSLQT